MQSLIDFKDITIHANKRLRYYNSQKKICFGHSIQNCPTFTGKSEIYQALV